MLLCPVGSFESKTETEPRHARDTYNAKTPDTSVDIYVCVCVCVSRLPCLIHKERKKNTPFLLAPDGSLYTLVGGVAPGTIVPNTDALVGSRRRGIHRSRGGLLTGIVRVVAQG